MADERLPERLTAGLDRPTLERVLARAAELQARENAPSLQDNPELLSEAQLIEIAREVGLSETHIRQALAEERTRVLVQEEEGVASGITGPGVAVASRLVQGDAQDILAAVNNWMQHDECLRVQRQFSDRMVWEPRGDLLGNIRIGLGLGGRDYMLARSAASVSATVIQVDKNKALVRLDADVTKSRKSRVRTSSVIAGTGVAGGGAIMLAAGTVANAVFPIALVLGAVPMAIAAATAYGIARGHRRIITRTQLVLEQILDRLEHNVMPRSRGVLQSLASGRPLLR
jgi:hypothetical protein